MNRNEANMLSILEIIERYDPTIYMHSVNVSKMVNIYCKYYNVVNKEDIVYGALLHDVGKIFVDKRILNKPGKLTVEEFAEMRKHTIYGYEYLKSSHIPQSIYIYTLYHHHRVDGLNELYDFSKYIRNKGDLINNLSNSQLNKIYLLNICDSFEAMISARRSYKDSIDMDDAILELTNGKNTQFNASVTDKFIKIYNQYIKKYA